MFYIDIYEWRFISYNIETIVQIGSQYFGIWRRGNGFHLEIEPRQLPRLTRVRNMIDIYLSK